MSNEQKTPQFSDAELLAYLDGALEEALAQRIEQSGDAQRRLAQLARQQQQLAARLYRANCPDAHTLGEYQMRLLAAEQAAQVAQHIAICPHCALELDELRATLGDLASDLEMSVVERLRVLIARLVPDLPNLGASPAGMPGPAGMPALAGMRGAMPSQQGGPRLYEAGDIQLSLEVQDAAEAGRKSVLGLITGAEATGWQVTLWREEESVAELVQTVAVDELGNFVFDSLAPGAYTLTLRGDDVEVVIQDLAVS